MLKDLIKENDVLNIVGNDEELEIVFSEPNQTTPEYFIKFSDKNFTRNFLIRVVEVEGASNMIILNRLEQFAHSKVSGAHHHSYPLNGGFPEEDIQKVIHFDAAFRKKIKEIGEYILNDIEEKCKKENRFRIRNIVKTIKIEYVVSGIDIGYRLTR